MIMITRKGKHFRSVNRTVNNGPLIIQRDL